VPTKSLRFWQENARKMTKRSHRLSLFLQNIRCFDERADGRNSEQGAWQVLKEALLFPILERVPARDLSPLRHSNGLVPLSADGLLR